MAAWALLLLVAALPVFGSACSKPKEKVILVSSKQRLESMFTKTSKRRVRFLAVTCEQFRARHKRYPKSIQELGRSQQRRLLPLDLLDGWNRPIRYRLVSGRPKLCSAGPNGRFDDADDICFSTAR